MILTKAAYVLALAAGFVGVYFWRKTQSLLLRLEELQHKYEQEKKSQSNLREKNSTGDSLLTSKDKELSQKKRDLAELQKNHELLKQDLSGTVKTLQDQVKSSENQLDHYKTQTEVLLAQIKELDAENALLKKLKEQPVKEPTLPVRLDGEQSKRWQESHTKLEEQIQTLQTQFTELQEKERKERELLIRFKRRVHQSDHLYKTIRGQKEMFEERLENWEKALRMLSHWVLKDKQSSHASLGELVSAALKYSDQGSFFSEEEAPEDRVHTPVVSETIVEGAVGV
jgi:chromosome segregation ATPase